MNTILNNYPRTNTTQQRPRDLEDICGNFMGYYIHPSGRVISKNRHKFIEPTYRANVPYISLSEVGVSHTYRLDQVVFKSFNCFYVMGSKTIIHKDGDQTNCRNKNLSV
ncbi:MAG: hypothetical protein K0S41_2043 [Anaerocolumna sp.]|jgi:hypothetical protein|nr:hypothetical protein [Anaerocolumna sp.]